MAGAPPGQTLTVRVVSVQQTGPDRNAPENFRDRIRAQASAGVAASQAATIAAQQTEVSARPKSNFNDRRFAPTASPAERIQPTTLANRFATVEGSSNKARELVTGGAAGAILGKVFAPLLAATAVLNIIDQVSQSKEFLAAKELGQLADRQQARAFGALDATLGVVGGGLARTVGFDEIDVQSARRWFKETFTPGLIELEGMQAATTARKRAYDATYESIMQATAATAVEWRIPFSVFQRSQGMLEKRAREIAQRNAFNAEQRAKQAVTRGEAIANAGDGETGRVEFGGR